LTESIEINRVNLRQRTQEELLNILQNTALCEVELEILHNELKRALNANLELKAASCLPTEDCEMATKERLAAIAASRCAVCSGMMVATLIESDPTDTALELRTYIGSECGHRRTYSVDP
jgi:hypothetical protein